MSDTNKPTTTKAGTGPAGGPTPQNALVGGSAADDISLSGGDAAFAVGGVGLDVGTAVTDQLGAAVPSFGNVLGAIGNGVAASQKALDKGVIDTVTALNGKNITILTDVIEVLNDDGLPDGSRTQLVTEDVSVLNFFTPTLHEWKQVSIAMDLEVGKFENDSSLTFSQSQSSSRTVTTGLFWGFLGWTELSDSTTSSSVTDTRHQETLWQAGQVRVDAMLGPRNTGRFPVPDSISIGPQIFVTQGAVTEQATGGVTTARTIDVQIAVRKADGTANPSKPILLDAGGLLPSFTAGSSTDTSGNVQATLTRNLPAGVRDFQRFAITASLGQIRKTFSVTL